MRNYKITKDQIIEALETENLKPGNWFHAPLWFDNGDSPVNAVGAILRKVNPKNFQGSAAQDLSLIHI